MQFKANAITIAPLFGLLTACGSSNEPQSGQTVAQLFSSEARAEGAATPAPAEAAARGRGGPKGGGRDKIDTGRTVAPAKTGTAITPCVVPSPSSEAAMRRGGPKQKDKILVGRTATPVSTGAAEVEAAERRKEGPKGASGSDHDGQTEAPPAPDTQPAGRGAKPKGAGGHGRTAASGTDSATLTPCPAPSDAANQMERGRPKERDKIMTN